MSAHRRPAPTAARRMRDHRRTAPPRLRHRRQLLPPHPRGGGRGERRNRSPRRDPHRATTGGRSPSAPPAPACAARPSPTACWCCGRRPRHLRHRRRRHHRAGRPGHRRRRGQPPPRPPGPQDRPGPGLDQRRQIGGIAANNSSGMCCGTAQNSYNTLAAIRVMLADGTLLDTGDPPAWRLPSQPRRPAGQPGGLAARVRADHALASRIRAKYKIKNTTGYSLNALVDYTDPGHPGPPDDRPEGTLGFISRVTTTRCPSTPTRPARWPFFPDMESACRAVVGPQRPVDAVELLDRASLRCVADKPGMPPLLKTLPDGVTALLIEKPRAQATTELAGAHRVGAGRTARLPTHRSPRLHHQPGRDRAPVERALPGTFPAVGAVRKPGTTVIIEDVAFRARCSPPPARPAAPVRGNTATTRRSSSATRWRATCTSWFTQDFGIESEVARYAAFMDELCTVLVEKIRRFAEGRARHRLQHGPFVEPRMGQPGLRADEGDQAALRPRRPAQPRRDHQRRPHRPPQAPQADARRRPALRVDRCIECGFCGTPMPVPRPRLSPRQRIVGWRELSRRRPPAKPRPARRGLPYMGLDTCATCGLCSTACPVGIETGAPTAPCAASRLQRGPQPRPRGRQPLRRHPGLARTAPQGRPPGRGHRRPLAWRGGSPAAPGRKACRAPGPGYDATRSSGDKVVYFPPAPAYVRRRHARAGPSATVIRVLERAGYAPIVPEGVNSLCCGQSFASKGLARTPTASRPSSRPP